MLGTTELIVIGGVALALFGGAQLPKLAKSLGTFVNDFNDAKEGKVKKSTKKATKKPTTKKKPATKKTAKKKAKNKK